MRHLNWYIWCGKTDDRQPKSQSNNFHWKLQSIFFWNMFSKFFIKFSVRLEESMGILFGYRSTVHALNVRRYSCLMHNNICHWIILFYNCNESMYQRKPVCNRSTFECWNRSDRSFGANQWIHWIPFTYKTVEWNWFIIRFTGLDKKNTFSDLSAILRIYFNTFLQNCLCGVWSPYAVHC